MPKFDVTYKSAKSCKTDYLSDFERRELDCWIAEHIEQHHVRHDVRGIKPDNPVRLSDLAYREFLRLYPNHRPNCKGPFVVAHYSFSPSVAVNVFQDTEYAEGWVFGREDGKWIAVNDGLQIPACNSFAMCLMLALKHEYEYQNQKEAPHAHDLNL